MNNHFPPPSAASEASSAGPPPTVASAAVAADEPGLARSFRFHRPRGPICASGWCAQCEIPTADGHALACQIAPEAGVAGRRPPRFRLLGRAAELVPPWFYERRFLRPRTLRRSWLRLLRHLSAAAPLAGSGLSARGVRRYVELAVETVVVGPSDEHPDAFTVRPDEVLGLYPGRVLGVLRDERLIELRFERIVIATGSYDRLPPVPGGDLPGVLGLDAFDRFCEQGAIRPRTRIAVWAARADHELVRALAERTATELVWLSERAPRRIAGRRRVSGVVAEQRIACDFFVTAVRQPAIDLALQGGARARLTSGELPVLVVDDTPTWMDVVGAAAAQASGVPDADSAGDAIACLCEDVRVSDLHACVAQGFDSAELVKRRTGAMTGPCQGKLCASAVLASLRDAGVDPVPTRARPLARPVALRELAADA